MSATKALAQIPLRQLGRNGPHVANLGFGCMGIRAFYGQSSPSEETILKTLTYAADRRMNFWDTADIYGTCVLLSTSSIVQVD
jgi:aryl-alcohol dehydrogenase-like predicted oxidoreductase